jgi:hypothetical protein
MTSLWSKEPAVIIGLVLSIIALVAQQLLSSGLVSSTGSVSILNIIIGLVPLFSGVLTRSQVTPA